MAKRLKQFIGKLPTNCLSVFGHFMGLMFKELKPFSSGCSKSGREYASSSQYKDKNLVEVDISLQKTGQNVGEGCS